MNSQAFPRTYWDNNPDDRNYSSDFWTWLRDQPQDAWLLWARHANWDNAEGIFQSMLDDPDCDRAIAAWLLWNEDPAGCIRNPERFRSGSLVGKIIRNVERGYYSKSELFLDQHEICFGALKFAAALSTSPDPSPFAVPRTLCGPFPGRRARVPERYDAAIEAELDEFFRYSNGRLPRSEDEHWKWSSASLWTVNRLQLPRPPAHPVSAFARLSDLAYLEALFGKHEELESARRRAQLGITLEDKPGFIDTAFYGGVFLGEQRQLDRAWRRFLALSAILAGFTLLWTRLDMPPAADFAVAMLVIGTPAAILSFVEMGPRRKTLWFLGMTLLALAAAVLLRWIDKGRIG